MRVNRLRIVVAGYVVRGPLAGPTWHHLQYLIGLTRLGHDVYFLEDSDDYPSCYDPDRDETDTDPSYGLRYAARVFERVGLGDRWAYYDAHTSRWLGPVGERMPAICRHAELFVNVSGVNPVRPWLAHIPARALVDTDPAFTQIRHLTDPAAWEQAERHTVFFSFGENIGQRDVTVPDDGFPWQPTRQPLVLDAWPVTPGRPDARFTNVMVWESYPPRQYGGRAYGTKAHSFGPYLDFPSKTGRVFELALGGSTAPRTLLEQHGWFLLDPRLPTRDPWTYQRYIQESKAEFGVAKEGYVVTRCGWFSERSASYLASGRPVVIQDTGFSDWLPTGAGVLPFTTPEEALAAIEDINCRYEFHCRSAREIVEEYFDAAKVLTRLLSTVFQRGSGS